MQILKLPYPQGFISNTSYVVAHQAGGLEGCKPSKQFLFSACMRGKAAHTGGKEESRGGFASPNPSTA